MWSCLILPCVSCCLLNLHNSPWIAAEDFLSPICISSLLSWISSREGWVSTRVGVGCQKQQVRICGERGGIGGWGNVSTELPEGWLQPLNPPVVTALQGPPCSTGRQCENVKGRCVCTEPSARGLVCRKVRMKKLFLLALRDDVAAARLWGSPYLPVPSKSEWEHSCFKGDFWLNVIFGETM